MVKLSVNVNKVATLRNSRGGAIPSVLQAVDVCLAAGAPGITVHPRADERHIRPGDVVAIAERLADRVRAGQPAAEFNIEGDPRPDLIALVRRVRADQCTLVPVTPGEITSHAGWPPDTRADDLRGIVRDLRRDGIRVSLFIDPILEAVAWAARLGADRVELYTEPFARAYASGEAAGLASFEQYRAVAEAAHAAGLGINAGHDLDLDNLRLFRELPYLDEVSIGHALISHALWVGLDRAVRDYLDGLSRKP
ncbi:MAG: pyridoxine 5'-phosphate synthase [Acidobacteria bacterium]|nr:pyridoxine 5'-phosphate synthase [Acidobacteriota bacterium]